MDLRETKQIVYHSKGIDESYPKMYFLLNLGRYVKTYGHLCQFLASFMMSAPQIWPCHVIQEANFEINLFCLILHLILGKVTKFLVEKLSTSEVISQKPHGEWKTPPPPPPSAFRVNKLSSAHFYNYFACISGIHRIGTIRLKKLICMLNRRIQPRMGHDPSVTQEHITGTHFLLNLDKRLVYLTLKQNLENISCLIILLNLDFLSKIKYIWCDLYLIAIVTSDFLALILFLFIVNLNM